MACAVPSLSSVRTNRYEMGRRAINMVTAAIENNGPTEAIVDLGFELMIRQSSPKRRV
jgi:LacI family gluconate utilization system Gnt-I transcriptional repressor